MITPKVKMNFDIEVPLFPTVIEFCICNADDLDGFGPEDDALGGYNHEQSKVWINFAELKYDCDFLKTLVHECIHAAFGAVCTFADDRPSDMIGEECVAYIADHLFGEVIDKLVGDRHG